MRIILICGKVNLFRFRDSGLVLLKGNKKIMNKFVVKNVDVNENKIVYHYDIVGEWCKYFNTKHEFYIEYSMNIDSVPKSVCIIPLITGILPMIWIFNAELILDEIDKEFFESIPEFKKGFIKMYPMINFKGTVSPAKVVDNSFEPLKKVGAFFSGGVDATSTLVTHIIEKPTLINIHGSDISVNDKRAIEKIENNIISTAENFELETIFITSTFKDIIRRKFLDNTYLKPKAKDTYWHGFQHGIAIIGHAAPIAHLYKFKKIYIASSYTKEDKVTCASDPTIDNFVKLCSTTIEHDGYEFNRIDKMNNIGTFSQNTGNKFKLRVCLDEYNATNCCQCEKCYRTIYEILANGYDPRQFGFNYDNDIHQNIEKDFRTKIVLNYSHHWNRIKAVFLEKKQIEGVSNEQIQWIYDYNFDGDNDCLRKYIKSINRKRSGLLKRIKNFRK